MFSALLTFRKYPVKPLPTLPWNPAQPSLASHLYPITSQVVLKRRGVHVQPPYSVKSLLSEEQPPHLAVKGRIERGSSVFLDNLVYRHNPEALDDYLLLRVKLLGARPLLYGWFN